MTDEKPLLGGAENRIDEGEQVARAAATLAEAMHDPVRMAAENAALRSSTKGAHAIAFVLTQRLGGDVVVSREEWQSPDPQLELKIEAQPDGSVHLWVKKRINTAIRPKRRR